MHFPHYADSVPVRGRAEKRDWSPGSGNVSGRIVVLNNVKCFAITRLGPYKLFEEINPPFVFTVDGSRWNGVLLINVFFFFCIV